MRSISAWTAPSNSGVAGSMPRFFTRPAAWPISSYVPSSITARYEYVDDR